jgi:hypothetical protein
MLMFLHPVFMGLTFMLECYAMYLGIRRLLANHFGIKSVFQWNRHVILGRIAKVCMVAGGLGGIAFTHFEWEVVGATGLHFQIAVFAAMPMACFGLVSGHYLNKVRKRRKVLPLVHGLNNIVLICLSSTQMVLGLRMVLG